MSEDASGVETQTESPIKIARPPFSMESIRGRVKKEGVDPAGEEGALPVRLVESQFRQIIGSFDGFRKDLGEKFDGFQQTVVEILNKTEAERGEFLELLRETRDTLERRRDADDDSPELRQTLNEVREAILRQSQSTAEQARRQAIYNELLEAQTPRALRIPTPELLFSESKEELIGGGVFTEQELNDLEASGLIKEGVIGIDPETRAEVSGYRTEEGIYRNKIYQQKVEDWFEERLRYMETFETAFEEQPEIYNRLVVVETFFRFRDETKPLAERLHKRIEARRLKQRMVRVWKFATPDNLGSEASRFTLDVMEELFTYETKDETGNKRNPIVEELNAYERMGVELKMLKESKKRLVTEGGSVSDIEDADRSIKIKKQEIMDYYKHGGYTTDAMGGRLFVDEEVSRLEEIKAVGELDEEGSKRLKKLSEDLWSRKSAGGLWSVTFRAASFGIQLNGTSDYFAGRIMNFNESLEGRALLKKTEGIWNPKKGKYKDKPFDLGLQDFFSNALGNESLDSLEQLNLGDREFWDNLGKSKPDQYYSADQIDKFVKADRTRQAFWGSNGFFHNPDLNKFLKLSEVFDHIPDKEVVVKDENGNPVMVNGEVLKTSARQEVWQEILERTVNYMREEEDAKEVFEPLRLYPDAIVFSWIEESSINEMLTNQQSNHLFQRYLNVPFRRNPRGGAQMRAALSILTSPLRYPQARHHIAFGTLWELIRQAFGQVFSEEIGRR